MVVPSPSVRRFACAVLWCAVALWAPPTWAQVPDSLQARPDTVFVRPDVAPPRTAPRPERDGVSQPVQFSARDSLVLRFRPPEEGGDVGQLYGEADVQADDARLEAFTIDILFGRDELQARGLRADTGWVGRPAFAQGGETFQGDELAFNLRTERGRIVGAQTAFEEGFIRAGVAKIAEDSTLYIRDGVYTTCPCVEDPSYSLRSSKMKVVDQKWIYTGPIQLYLFNIPMPLWLPFGFLPAQEGRRSGPLPPQYGEDEFGFYLRDWGWYFALNDYMDLQLQGGFWTKGSWQANALYRYRDRYAYNGQAQVSYGRFRSGERGDPGFGVRTTAALRWNHSQPLSPSSNFSANVNLSSSGYLRAISQDYDDRVRQTIQSSISYSKRWREAGRSLNLNLSQQQVLATGAADLTLPSLSFSQNARKPFAREDRTSAQRERWYERITYSYNATLNNRYGFSPLADELLAATDPGALDISWYEALFSPSKYRRATGDDEPFDFRASHSVPVSAAFTVNRVPLLGGVRLNLSPNVGYSEDWFIRTERRELIDSTNTVVTRSVPGFYALRQFSTGISANTTIYGLFPVRLGPFEGLRHTLRPSTSFTYQPDFSADAFGTSRVLTDTTGREIEYTIVPGVRSVRQQTMTFSLGNVFETKRVRVDSTGEAASSVLRLLTSDLSTSYNFAADSLRLSTISLTGRTRLFDEVDVNFRSTFSPYRTDSLGRVVNDYVFSLPGLSLARLTSASLTARTSVRSRQQGQSRPAARPQAAFTEADEVTGELVYPGAAGPTTGVFRNTPVGYADFAIPWSLTLDFTYGITRSPGAAGLTVNRRAILNAGFDFNLTPNWKLQGRTGYDFEQAELVTTNLSVYRDFDCWQMSFNWVPFGAYQSYSFDLRVKSSHLGDLLRIRQPRSDVRGRFGSLL